MKRKNIILFLLIMNFGVFQVLAQVVETSKGKVEFIGLEKWTMATIQEKLGYKTTDGFHFCAADLKAKLGFPDVSVTLDSQNGKAYTIITVVEPERAAEIKYNAKPGGSVTVPELWKSLTGLLEERMILNEILDYGKTLKNANKSEKPLLTDADTSWWKILEERRSKEDFQLALKVLAEDKEFKNRAAASLILTNFAEHDAAWQALMNGVLDKDSRVNSAALQSLITLTKYVPRKVAWSAASAQSLRHILNGTNLFALHHVVRTLIKTKASHNLTKTLLRENGGRMLLAYLRAENQERKELSQQLLTQLSNKNFGFDNAKWTVWMNTL